MLRQQKGLRHASQRTWLCEQTSQSRTQGQVVRERDACEANRDIQELQTIVVKERSMSVVVIGIVLDPETTLLTRKMDVTRTARRRFRHNCPL
jgi:hypothetical protein